MVANDVTLIEEQIRVSTQTRRVRPSEFFLDYDRLRSGFVTDTQFARVLWENLAIKLTPEQMQALGSKYDLKKDGRWNYRYFCDVIDQPFDPNCLKDDPVRQKKEAAEFLGTGRSVQPLAPGEEGRIESLLRSLQKFYQYRGINLRTSCEDFDRHHIGVIKESQFYRSFPRPPEVTEEDVDILVRKYRDPDRAGLLNYLNLHHDLVAIGQLLSQEETTCLPDNVNVSDYLPAPPGADTTLQQIFDRIRVAVFKNRVRSIEFFKDYDKLRSGIITENQFVCGLSLAIGKEAQLSRSEIQKVVEYYRQPDGRVHYKEFCDSMENAFNVPDLEKKPTLDVVRPPEGALGRNLAALTAGEEERMLQVISELSDQVRRRRLMVYQYFKDFDRSKGYSRVITPTQFGRILHFLSLNVAPEDLKLLCRKFADAATGDVNYPAFVQTVDKEFVNYTQSLQREPTTMKAPSDSGYASPELLTFTQPADISLDDLLARIRHHILTNRLRVCEYFQDFDPLRSGSIPKSQFRRGLSDLGLSALGLHNLSENQYKLLCTTYQDPKMADKVLWRQFMGDLESVFTQPQDLEKIPSHKVPPQEIYRVPKPGTMNWDFASDEHKNFLFEIMERLRQRANQRRVLPKPTFQDFDKHNNGYVTRPQFRQCLTMLELHCTEDEMQALEAKFCNDTGFHYLAFLEELQPANKPTLMYLERLKEIRATNQKGKLPEHNPARDLENILIKIKTKVFKERMRIHEWMRDYDKLRSGRMPKVNFRRALDLCKFELLESELAILENHYQSAVDIEHVDYLQFSDDIEAIFTTKNLEKAPLLDADQFQPPVECSMNKLEPAMEEMASKCMDRLAKKVRLNRMQLFPLFEDYDRVHNGTVSRSQFQRVLNELELASLVSSQQEWTCLWKKFEAKIGGKDDVNYVAFCDMIYDLAKFEWRKP